MTHHSTGKHAPHAEAPTHSSAVESADGNVGGSAPAQPGKAVSVRPEGRAEAGGPLQDRPAAAPPLKEAGSLRPTVVSIVQAGAFGAALGGMSAGVAELARVKQGEISSDQAVRNVMRSSAQGAATMAVASLAGQVVRAHPVIGVLVLAAAGIGALTVLGNVTPNAGAVAAAPRRGTTAAKGTKKPARPAGEAPASA